MAETDKPTGRGRAVAVPSGRLGRLARFGGMTGAVAGGMAAGGLRALASGRRPDLRELLLTPANAGRVADELARMRGAAMKVGQLLSMDGGDLIPEELAEILARLRAEADFMPPRQLRSVLDRQWGRGWLARFESFEVRPVAAASIGQVHRARTKDGRTLAIKVQYPGVRRSIGSDVDNVATLIRLSGLAPDGLDLAPLMEEAKRQLAEEADYAREADQMTRFADMLDGTPGFHVPRPHADLSTGDVLAMDWAEGGPVERLADAPQETRDRVAAALMALTLRELFELGRMQTDPNFANYLWDAATGRIVLLDFGAAREIPAEISAGYRTLLRAGLAGDRAGMDAGARAVGFYGEADAARHREAVLDMIAAVMTALRQDMPLERARAELAPALRDRGMALAQDRDFGHVAPMITLLIQRKLAGIALLATRLDARVSARALVEPWV